MNDISMRLNADDLILAALKEDITSEDISTNAVMRQYQLGEVDLICKEDGVIAGLDVFKRVFQLLDDRTEVTFTCVGQIARLILLIAAIYTQQDSILAECEVLLYVSREVDVLYILRAAGEVVDIRELLLLNLYAGPPAV